MSLRNLVRAFIVGFLSIGLSDCIVVQPGGGPFLRGGYYGGAPIVVQPASMGAGAGVAGVPMGPTRTVWGAPPVYVQHPVTGQSSTPLQAGYAICDQGGPCMSNDPVARLRNGW